MNIQELALWSRTKFFGVHSLRYKYLIRFAGIAAAGCPDQPLRGTLRVVTSWLDGTAGRYSFFSLYFPIQDRLIGRRVSGQQAESWMLGKWEKRNTSCLNHHTSLNSWPQILRTKIRKEFKGAMNMCGDEARSVQRLGPYAGLYQKRIKERRNLLGQHYGPVFGLFFLFISYGQVQSLIATKWWTTVQTWPWNEERKVYASRISTISGPGESPQRKI